MVGQGVPRVEGRRRLLGQGVGRVEDRPMVAPFTTRRRITIQL